MKKVKGKILNYTAIFKPAEEGGGYVVTVPKLYGLTTEGNTLSQAKEMTRDAIKIYIENLISQGKSVPIENTSKVINIRLNMPIAPQATTTAFA